MEYKELRHHKWLDNVYCGVEISDPDWVDIVDRLIVKLDRAIPEEHHDKFTIDQIKYKWGGLRFYVSYLDRFPLTIARLAAEMILVAELQVSNLMMKRRLDKVWRENGKLRGTAQ